LAERIRVMANDLAELTAGLRTEIDGKAKG
jgi:hypothetical protein